MTRRIRAGALPAFCAAALALAGCGEDDFENEPRPPVPVQLTGVITQEKVTVSPNELGAGPVVITVSNQTKASHTLTLESSDGGTIHPGQALRWVVGFPISVVLFGLGFVTIVFQHEHRALHDLIAGTAIVYDWGERPAELPGPLSAFLSRHEDGGSP